jgi:hypothetical protein
MRITKLTLCLLVALCLVSFVGCCSITNPSDPPVVDTPDPNDPDPNDTEPDDSGKIYATSMVTSISDMTGTGYASYLTTKPFEDIEYTSSTRTYFENNYGSIDISPYSEFYVGNAYDAEYQSYVTIQSDGTARYTTESVDGVEYTYCDRGDTSTELDKWFVYWSSGAYISDNSIDNNEESEDTLPADITNNDGRPVE